MDIDRGKTAIFALAVLTSSLGAQSTSGPVVLESWRADADLRDVTFVDDDYGWAVGDHGTIWHTQNGGEIWRPQDSRVTNPLCSVHFVDRLHGWAAGGTAIPQTQMTEGTVLRTEDGGQTWQVVDGLLLPWINAISFATTQHGVAVGHASSNYPTGIWVTSDAGRTWSPLSGERGVHWLQADFLVAPGTFTSNGRDRFVGMLRGHDGRVAWLANGRTSTVVEPSDAWPRHTFVAMIRNEVGVVGTQGMAMTGDGGHSWQEIARYQPDGIQKQTRWNTMAIQDNHAWMAGAPGNRIMLSTDFGQTWQAIVAPSTLPLRKLCFASATRGWAVGDGGTILSTKDAGKTWHRQRAGNKRNALLGIFADQRDIPWSLLAQASAVDELRTHIVLLGTAGDVRRSGFEQRLQHAASLVGATAEVLMPASFPSEVDLPAELLMERWQNEYPAAVDWLSERLTRIIRERRPDVVLTSEFGHGRERTGSQRLTSRLVADACDYAGNELAFSSQHLDLGLVPWQVSRVLAYTAKSSAPRSAKSTRTTGLGLSPEELATYASQILGSPPSARKAWTLKSLQDESEGDLGTQPFAGLVVEYGSSARRVRPAPTRAFDHRSKLAYALARAGNAGLQRIEQIETLAAGDAWAAGKILFELANEESRADERDQLLRELATRYPHHPYATAALVRLVQTHTSLEAKWRTHQETPTPPTATLLTDAAGETPDADASVRLASAETGTFQPDWSWGLRLLQEVEMKRPWLSVEPEIAFPLASLPRPSQPQAASSKLQQQLFPNGWPQYAKLERMLVGAEQEHRSTSSIWPCRTVPTRPHLDGDLSDEIWKSTEFRALEVVDGPRNEGWEPTQVGIAKDAAYLYLAVYCPKRAGVDYQPIRKQRPRDADLSAHDRICVNLDVNRDYTSWWSFAFDDRGWTNDGWMDDRSWDPKYYVATQTVDRVWSMEAAIPLDSLAPEDHRDSTFWAVGVERVVPESHVERWNSSHDDEPSPNLQGILHLP